MASLETMTVRDYMSTKLLVFSPDQEVMKAVNELVRTGHSGAPVVDAQGQLVGVLSERDCLQVALIATQDNTCLAGPISAFMTTTIETVSPDLSLTQLVSRFTTLPYRRYPVLEDGRLVGQISRSDVLRAISHLC